MKTEALNYDLPTELIAQQPTDVRSDSRLLLLKRSSGELIDSTFSCIGEYLHSDDCLVLNDTKVVPARFFACRASGAKLEGLFLEEKTAGFWQIMLKPARKVKPGQIIIIKDRQKRAFCTAKIVEKLDKGLCLLEIQSDLDCESILEAIGFPPLPPYIKRDANPTTAAMDKLRYQTVYARQSGAVAAPTAGLHFTDELIGQLKSRGVSFANITLHVGAGTFTPVTTDNLAHHDIHSERYSLNDADARIINAAKRAGGRIIAVGTTSVRTLETLASASAVEPASGTTNLFITPGYQFKMTDAMVTNFHLPKSTLLALVAAFAGLDEILRAYRHAVEKRYRFYSYGDAMLIL